MGTKGIRCVKMDWDGDEGPWLGEGIFELI